MPTYYAHVSVHPTAGAEPAYSGVGAYLAVIATAATNADAIAAMKSGTSLTYRVIATEDTISITTSLASTVWVAVKIIRPGFSWCWGDDNDDPWCIQATAPPMATPIFPNFFIEGPVTAQSQYVSYGALKNLLDNMTPSTISGTTKNPAILNDFIIGKRLSVPITYDNREVGQEYSPQDAGFIATMEDGPVVLLEKRLWPLKYLSFNPDLWDCDLFSCGVDTCNPKDTACPFFACYCDGSDTCLRVGCPFDGGCPKDVCPQYICLDACACDGIDASCPSDFQSKVSITWRINNNWGTPKTNYVIPFIIDEARSGASINASQIVSEGTLITSQSQPSQNIAFLSYLSGTLQFNAPASPSSNLVYLFIRFDTSSVMIPNNPGFNPAVTLDNAVPTVMGHSGQGTSTLTMAVQIDISSSLSHTVVITFDNSAY